MDTKKTQNNNLWITQTIQSNVYVFYLRPRSIDGLATNGRIALLRFSGSIPSEEIHIFL